MAKRVIVRYRPTVVGVTGSVGKTTAKEAIYAVLSRRFWTRKNEENFNNEIGVPMAVLGVDAARFTTFGYKLAAIVKSLWLAYGWPPDDYPKMLALELAADRPGDIGYLVDIVKPQVGVVTAIGEVPVHVEFYASPEEIAAEKSKLIKQLEPPAGLAVLNYDDLTVLEMKDIAQTKVVTFGFSRSADVAASDISYFAADDKQSIGGLSFKVSFNNSFIPIRVNNLIGKHQIYGILAGVAVGLHFGMNMVEISDALENIELPHGRMNLLRGIKNSVIIDDTYNASPLSTHAALDTLLEFTQARLALGHHGRKIAVLGDMRELGKYQIEAHRTVGNLAAERADILVTVGLAAKFIADSAANQIPAEAITSFSTSSEAASRVRDLIQEGDVILVKGSRSMEMEKVVKEISV